MKKKLLMVALSIAMAFAAAVPAFADGAVQPRYTLGQFTVWNTVVDNHPLLLNVSRSKPTPANMQKITLYEDDPFNPYLQADQTFTVQFASRDGRPRFYSYAGYNSRTRTGYSFNMNTSNYGVMLYSDQLDNYQDAEVDLWTKTYNGIVVNNITLPNRNNRCVTIRSKSVNSQVFWDNYITGNANQYWHCGA